MLTGNLAADAPTEARNANAEHLSFANEGRRKCDDSGPLFCHTLDQEDIRGPFPYKSIDNRHEQPHDLTSPFGKSFEFRLLGGEHITETKEVVVRTDMGTITVAWKEKGSTYYLNNP
jgi:hypothetical protein